MCGIAGVLDPRWRGTGDELAALAAAMAAPLAHRGPDDEGTWCDPAAGVGLGHRRLAVVDLSPAGHQPMVSADGRWVIAYNGECYNAAELGAALAAEGTRLRGRCDTEVVVEAVAAWGLRATLERLNAMFALALWDRRERVLHLVRDRLGEKPLYYAVVDGIVTFGSELRALGAHPGFRREIDRHALAMYLRLNYVPAPLTIYAGARKLAAGTLVSLRAGQGGWPEPTLWWDFPAVARAAMASRPPPGADTAGAVDHLDRLLRDSVARRTVADVGVGTFLSGGIDSSLVTALAQAQSAAPVRTFTVGFAGEADETAPAAAVARHLGTDHTQIDLTAKDALGAVAKVATCWDEPFADPSQLPTLLMCREARRHVTVALSGDGGDEGFGGYNRYVMGAAVCRAVLPWPAALRRGAASAVATVPPATWDRVGRGAGRLSGRLAVSDLGTKAHKLARVMGAASPTEVYVGLVSSWDDAESVVIGGPFPPWQGPARVAGIDDPADAMMAWDTASTLPDEMLAKVDRASMCVGLEARVPLLDHRVVEAAWALTPSLRIAGGSGKHALRRVLERYVPHHLVDRPKTGFDPPLGAWLRGPLREWAEGLLSASRLRAEGYLDPAPVRACWADHLSGRASREYALWAVLVFEAWLEGQDVPRAAL
ncbi:MAG TPA: asparagine synthase (glutamine-hydrolyzing) [Acidimicrobiales bacterium]|nr:asparagine synthase (glutamine-hydrolyzing) [Acidimicrobiales bacterium]